MTAIEQAIVIIKRFEGIRHKVYLCPANRLSIGWGSTRNVVPGMEITTEEADVILRAEVAEVENDVRNAVKVPLKDHQLAALISLTHNIGITRFRESTLLKKLNGKDRPGAAAEFTKWVHAKGKRLPGLVKRRGVERDHFMTTQREEKICKQEH